MPCYHPLKALRDSSGVTILPGDAKVYNLRLPCGQCSGCLQRKSIEWALRCVHEASLHEFNSFITLTYSEDNVPFDGGLHYRDFQLFMKRLRREFPDKVIRYYGCGEYGGERGRPHFHAILFGLTFTDLSVLRKSPAGNSLFRSATLERLWPHGYSSIGRVTFQSAAYVSRYTLKKIRGRDAKKSYETVDITTGEIFERRSEFNFMSLKPGIGAGWFEKYFTDVFPHDVVIHNGQPNQVPRYYDKILSKIDPDLLAEIKSKRMLDAEGKFLDNTPERLVVKEIVHNAQLSKLKRSL